MNIVSRAQWGAQYAAGAGLAPLPAREVWLHHSVTIAPDLLPPYDDEDAAMRTLERIGQDRFKQGVSYTFAVMPTGRVFEGHGVGRLGAHTGGRNSIARGIVLVGNYDVTRPTAMQIESTAQLLVDGYRAGHWTAARLNGGHRQAPGASTACPGRYGMAVIAEINNRAAALLAGALPLEDELADPATIAQIAAQTRDEIFYTKDTSAAGGNRSIGDKLNHLIVVQAQQTAVIGRLAEALASQNQWPEDEFKAWIRESIAEATVKVTVSVEGDEGHPSP